jgi:hypothetical protein
MSEEKEGSKFNFVISWSWGLIILVLIILFAGEPDLMDAIITYLMK